jgi:hypothetical protein
MQDLVVKKALVIQIIPAPTPAPTPTLTHPHPTPTPTLTRVPQVLVMKYNDLRAKCTEYERILPRTRRGEVLDPGMGFTHSTH